MKRNKLHILEGAKVGRLSRSEALHLLELYFDAETTEHQELMLRDYVVNEGKDDVAFNEVRAFMGLWLMQGRVVRHWLIHLLTMWICMLIVNKNHWMFV